MMDFYHFLSIAVNKERLLQPPPSALPSEKCSREPPPLRKLGSRSVKSVNEQEKVDYVQISTLGREKNQHEQLAGNHPEMERGNLSPPSPSRVAQGTFASTKPSSSSQPGSLQ